jgi:hypothetical protein
MNKCGPVHVAQFHPHFQCEFLSLSESWWELWTLSSPVGWRLYGWEMITMKLPPSSFFVVFFLLFFCWSVHMGALLFWRLESELAVAFNAIDAITLHIWASLGAMCIARLQTTDSVCLHIKRLCIKFGCCRIGRA